MEKRSLLLSVPDEAIRSTFDRMRYTENNSIAFDQIVGHAVIRGLVTIEEALTVK